MNKRDDLDMAVSNDEPDMVFITEVIPKAQTLPLDPAVLALQGYTLFTNFDPCESHLGSSGTRGICAYVRESISASEVSFPRTQFKEQLWIQVKMKGNDVLMVGCIYRSPSGDPYLSVEHLTDLLRLVCLQNPSHLCIVGDFNMPQIDWRNNCCLTPDHHYAHTFLNAVHDAFLFQHVTEPTRFRGQCS